jgi:glycosyltransferase involved in cell wall biosynthesis
MKIGIVSNLYPPNARGGAELVAQRVADALYERGHDVVVLTTQPFDGVRSLIVRIRERTLAAVYRFFPLNLYYLKHDCFIPFPIRALWHLVDLVSPFGRSAIRQVIKDEEPEVIITHNLKGIGVAIGREIQKQGVPHIHTLHDVQLTVPSGLLIAGQEESWLNQSFLRRWYEAGVRRFLGTPDLVISPSTFLAEYYQGRGLFTNTRVEMLPNPVPHIQMTEREDRIAPRTNILYVGQLENHKGIKELFQAFDQLDDPEIELHIAGEGALTDYVCERAETNKRIRYHGFVSLKYLVKLLETTDAVVIPSTCYENSPTVIYESFLVGAPVIASNIGGIPELIEEGKTGLLVEPGNAQQLAQAMKEIHEHRDAWWAKSEQIQAQAKQYAIEKYVDQLEQYIKEVT